MTPEERGWLAGILEGEGCFNLRTVKKRYVYGQISVKMTDEDVVRRCYVLTGVGTFKGPYQPSSSMRHKLAWQWAVGAQPEVRYICELVLPLMGERRSAKIRELLAAMPIEDARHHGRPQTAETRAKISASMRRHHAQT